ARANLTKIADTLGPADWQALEKKPRYQVKTKPRRRRSNVKQHVVKKRKFKKIHTEAEHIAQFSYRPGKCNQTYRMIVMKKTLKVIKGEMNLFDDIRYFFYITNDWKNSSETMVRFYRGRADHENDIEQLKNGVRALQPASDTLLSNWAYMAIVSLAWDLKAWYGLLLPYRAMGIAITRMEFKRFVNMAIRIPCLVIKT
ncbi:MAG: IS1380 family transposase, partial [Actinomycetia bacterium]|nr:IS1380 family transposase [Actinomycetes bacterium]